MLPRRVLSILATGFACALIMGGPLFHLAHAQSLKAPDDPFGDIDLESLKKGGKQVPGRGPPAETQVAPPAQESAPVPEGLVRKEIVEIGRGTPERKAILDVVRTSVERRLGINVIFVVERLAVFGDWAYADLHPRTKTGNRIDYRQTRYAKGYHPDLDSDSVDVLLRRDGSSWSIVQEAFLPTDVAWEAWQRKYNLPRGLFLVE